MILVANIILVDVCDFSGIVRGGIFDDDLGMGG
jgi:hypothetical protein